MEEPAQTQLVYAAEDAVADSVGPRLTRWTHVEAFVTKVIGSPHYLDRFPNAPLEIGLQRRSRGARASVAVPAHRVILIRDGSWNAITVLHELAHLISPAESEHGPDFVATELELVRDHCGFDNYVALKTSFKDHRVIFHDSSLASSDSDD